jgi:hypothetical protein
VHGLEMRKLSTSPQSPVAHFASTFLAPSVGSPIQQRFRKLDMRVAEALVQMRRRGGPCFGARVCLHTSTNRVSDAFFTCWFGVLELDLPRYAKPGAPQC